MQWMLKNEWVNKSWTAVSFSEDDIKVGSRQIKHVLSKVLGGIWTRKLSVGQMGAKIFIKICDSFTKFWISVRIFKCTIPRSFLSQVVLQFQT